MSPPELDGHTETNRSQHEFSSFLTNRRVLGGHSRSRVGTDRSRTSAAPYTCGMGRLSFREQVLRAREDAIVQSVNRLLAEKGFDLMTVDQVAADVGIAKASLYKHFTSKEELAAAAMVRVLDRAHAAIEAIEVDSGLLRPLDRLQAVARWTMRLQLAGEMPALPAQNSTLRAALMANRAYMDRLLAVSERLGEWIHAAQAAGQIQPTLPPEVVLYTLFARACDPVLGMLKATGQHSDDRIVELLVGTCFNGLASAVAPAAAAASSTPARRSATPA